MSKTNKKPPQSKHTLQKKLHQVKSQISKSAFSLRESTISGKPTHSLHQTTEPQNKTGDTKGNAAGFASQIIRKEKTTPSHTVQLKGEE